MALRLCELGWTVGVRDVDAAREAECVRAGAEAHATPAALAAAHPVVVVAVVDAAQCDAVLFGDEGVATVRGRCRLLRRPLPDPRPGEHRSARRAPRRARHRLHRRADVGRPGPRPRRQHEPDGRLRRRAVRRASARLLEALSSKLFRRRRAARRRRPHQAGQQPARRDQPRRRRRGDRAGRAARPRSGAHPRGDRAVERAELDRQRPDARAPSPATWRRARTPRCSPRTAGSRSRWRPRPASTRRSGRRPPSASARPAPPASASSTTPACCSLPARVMGGDGLACRCSAAKRARSTLPPLMITPTRRPASSLSHPPGRGEAEAAGRLDDHLHALGEEAHRLHQLGVAGGEHVVDVAADDLEGDPAERLGLRAVGDRLRHLDVHPLALAKRLLAVVAGLGLDAVDPCTPGRGRAPPAPSRRAGRRRRGRRTGRRAARSPRAAPWRPCPGRR